MSDQVSASAYIADLITAIRRHWWKSLLFYVLFMALVLLVLLIVPRKYISTGKFFVKLGRGSVTLDPTATTSKTVGVQETREAEINSVADILASRAVIDRVVDRVGVEEILASNFIFDGLVQMPELPSFSTASVEDSVGTGEDYDTLRRREKAIRELDENLKVKATKKAATITVSYFGSTPRLAQNVVDAMMDTYLDIHIDAHQTNGAYSFFEEQLGILKEKVETGTQSIRDFKNEIGVASIEGERASIQGQLDRIELDIIAAEGDMAAVEEKIATLEKQLRTTDERLVTEATEGVAHEGNDLMRDRLFALQIQEKELLTKFNETHPQVQQVRRQLEQARTVYDEVPENRVETKTAINPVYQDIEQSMLRSRAERQAVQAKVDAHRIKRNNMNEELEELNRNAAKLEMMQRELDIAKSSHTNYAEKLEEARINRELDLERFSNVKVVQPATLTLKPAKPPRLLLFALSGIVGMAAAIGLAQLLETSDKSLRSNEDVARYMKVPVLASMPREAARKVIAH